MEREAREGLRVIRKAITRRRDGIQCQRGEHIARVDTYDCICGGGISKRALEKTIGQPLPDVSGWGGYQLFQCVVCDVWVLLSYCGEGETVISPEAAEKLK